MYDEPERTRMGLNSNYMSLEARSQQQRNEIAFTCPMVGIAPEVEQVKKGSNRAVRQAQRCCLEHTVRSNDIR